MIDTIISHYKIIEKLGAGGMGVVYKAKDLKLDRIVALKFLPPYLSTNDDEKQRFVHEAKAASALQHVNICNIHDIDDSVKDKMFIVMDYYDGETLENKIAKKSPTELNEILKIIIQICEGLAYAHEKEIIHRDIKPANIIVTDTNVVKILDFGLAKLKGQTKLTKEGATLGTIAYMSPEQAQGDMVDNRTDIWSLGVLAYEMITGMAPFRGEYDQAILYSIQNEDPGSISSIREGIPAELDIIVKKMLEKNPEDRYQNFLQIIEDLDGIIEGKSVKVRSIRKKPSKLFFYLTPLTVAIFTILIVLFYPDKSIPFTERDWVLITDFENNTDEEIFDKSLNTAFSLSINQSSYVNVLSRRRVYESLLRMGRQEESKVNDNTGREIAIREGIQIMIVPTIAKVGTEYVLTGEIRETNTGNTLESEIIYANGQREVLDGLDELGHKMRLHLGESRLEISSQTKPLSQVTTTSLEALKQFTLGIEHHWKSDFDNAKNYYELALKIDTGFVSAKVSLGNLLFEKYDREAGQKLIAESMASMDRLTEREKYGILAFHAVAIEQDLNKAVEYMNMCIEIYPDDPTPHNNLGWYYQNLGYYDKAVEHYKKALNIDPYLMLTYGGVNWTYLQFLGKPDSALVWSKKMVSYGENNWWGYFYLGSAYVGLDSLELAEKAYRKSNELNPGFILNNYRLAHVLRIQQKYSSAVEILMNILQIDENEISAHYNLGINYQKMNKPGQAKLHLDKFRKSVEQSIVVNPDQPGEYISLAVTLARIGENKQALDTFHKGMTLDSTQYLRVAEFYSVMGNSDKSLQYLETALENGYRDVVWIRLDQDLEFIQQNKNFRTLIRKYM